MAKKIFAANWKMHKTPQQTEAFFQDWRVKAQGLLDEVFFFVPALVAEATARNSKDSGFYWGLQNFFPQEEGAFTGENSATVAKAMGASLSLVGHSERRTLFAEKDESINRKVKFALALGHRTVLCIGETLEDREAGKTEAVVTAQLSHGLAGVVDEMKERIVVAYEPVWAIGTGRSATSGMVEETHTQIRNWLDREGYGSGILYGGSVKAENARELLSVSNVDGFLVGGASLLPESFLTICQSHLAAAQI